METQALPSVPVEEKEVRSQGAAAELLQPNPTGRHPSAATGCSHSGQQRRRTWPATRERRPHLGREGTGPSRFLSSEEKDPSRSRREDVASAAPARVEVWQSGSAAD